MSVQLLRLIPTHVCVHAAMTGTRLTIPLLALQHGYSVAAIGTIISLFALAQVFLALPAGRYTDRAGLRIPISRAIIAASIGSALAALMPTFPVLCVAALLNGGATGVTLIAIQRHAGRAAKNAEEVRNVFSWIAIGPAIASVIGPFGAGALIDHITAAPGSDANFRAAFGAMALLPLIGWLFIRNAVEAPPEPPPAPRASGRSSMWDLFRSPMFRRLLFVNWLQASSWDVHSFAIPLLGTDRGLSASEIGAILGAFGIAVAAVRLLLPLLAARVSEQKVVLASTGLTAVIFGIYPLLSSPLAMGVCSVCLGATLGAVQPMVMSMLHRVTPRERHGEALGLRLLTINASSVAVPIVFGSLGTVIGAAGIFWIVGLVVALGTPAARGLREPSE